MLLEALDEGIMYDFPEDAGAVRTQLAQGIRLLREADAIVRPELTSWEDVRQFLSEDQAGVGVRYLAELREDFADVVERFAEHDPYGALLPAMLLVREWERTSPKWLMRSTEGARNWGWNRLVAPLARTLFRCDAIWSGQLIVNWAIGVLRKPGYEQLDGPSSEALYELGTLLGQFRQRYRERRDELAWYLVKEARDNNRVVIVCLAALYWTLGDAWQAQELREGRLKPGHSQVQVMLDAALRISVEDPMIGGVASWLWHENVHVQGHDSMRRRLTRWLGDSAAGIAFESLGESLGVSPSKVYGDVLVKWFLGTATAADVQMAQTLGRAVADSKNYVVVSARSVALANLVDPSVENDESWWRLASWCASKTELGHWTGTNGRYEAPLDLPLFYLDGGNEEVLRAIEEQRWGTLGEAVWYSIPEKLRESSGGTAQEIASILSEMHMIRYVLQLPRLPGWVAQVSKLNWKGEELDPKEWSDEDQAYDKAMEHRARLHGIARELKRADADIGDVPILGGTSLADFASILE
jgi:hypothetical protein